MFTAQVILMIKLKKAVSWLKLVKEYCMHFICQSAEYRLLIKEINSQAVSLSEGYG